MRTLKGSNLTNDYDIADSNLNQSRSLATPRIIQGASMIACICIGAGMLGLPSAGAGAWTLWSILLLGIAMVAMSASGCCLLEVLQTYDKRVSIASITKDLLGLKVALVTNLAVYFVGGVLLYAYTTSSGLMIEEFTGLDSRWASILFVAICSLSVWHSSILVSRISVVLIGFVVISFCLIAGGLVFEVELSTLLELDLPIPEQALYSLSLFPIALASFGYHHNVSTVRDIYQNEHKAQSAIIGGTMLAFIMYVLWLVAVFGNVPRESFVGIIQQGGNVNILLSELSNYVQSPIMNNVVTAFTASAILSSFICVGMGVFDYLADLFKFDDSKQGRAKSLAVTFLPPLFASLVIPFGFLAALNVAASAAAFWACIIPALLVIKARSKRKTQGQIETRYKVPGGNLTLSGILIFGSVVIFIHVSSFTTLIPQFGIN